MHATYRFASYRLKFEDGVEAVLDVPCEVQDPPPDWARLEHCQCRNCPLNKEQTPYCPFAIALVSPLRSLEGRRSYDKVDVSIDWRGRHLDQSTTLQRVLSSLIGLIGASSGCPHTRPLIPMAHFHQPFSDASETLFRVLGTHFIGQYLRSQYGLSVAPDMEQVQAVYRSLREINQGMAARLRSACDAEQSVNGLVLLDVLAAETLEHLKAPDQVLMEIFAPYFDDMTGSD